MRTELWTIPLTYTCKVIVINPRCHPQIECIFSSQCGWLLGVVSLVLVVELWDPAHICWPSSRSGLVPEIQSQLNCSSSRERGILGRCPPAFLLIACTGCRRADNWLLGEQGAHGDWVWTRVGVWMDRGCSLVWCMSFFRSECEWMDVITVFTMVCYKMDYFQ